jgi:FAS-associated factor 2
MEAKVAMERQEAEERRMREEEIRMEEERRAREIEECRTQKIVRMNWRRWARRALILPDLKNSKQSLRITIRLRDGLVIHNFSTAATLTTLYAFVDGHLIPRELDPADDPYTSPDGLASGEEDIEHLIVSRSPPDEWWGFRLVLAYPRREIKWEPGVKLCDIDQLKGGGQVVVEMVEGAVTQEEDAVSD